MSIVPAAEWDEPFEPGDDEAGANEAGASLEREYRRRKHARERRAMDKHPRIGRLLVAVSDEPQHQRAFQTGARGERTVAQFGGPQLLVNGRDRTSFADGLDRQAA